MIFGGVAALGWSASLVFYDISEERLPNWLTLPAAAAALVVCLSHPLGLWGLIWPAAYLILGSGIGGGDVKLAVPLGVGCALVTGLFSVVAAIAISSGLTLVAALALRRGAVPHGPSMLAAAWLVGLYGTFHAGL